MTAAGTVSDAEVLRCRVAGTAQRPASEPTLDVADAAVSFIRVFDEQGFDGNRERVNHALHALRRAAGMDNGLDPRVAARVAAERNG
jgi:hypothetical protein